MNKNIKSGAGFTIIELIVVIAIIAILAAIVMVNVTQYINKSKEAAVIANMNEVTKIAIGYIAENGSYSGLHNDPQIAILEKSVKDINYTSYASSINLHDESGYNINNGFIGTDGYTCEGKWVFFALGTVPFEDGSTNVFTYCVDSSGYAGLIKTDDPLGVAECTCGL